MAVASLDLSTFRNHPELSVSAAPGAIAIVGPNGAGKTNILEALSLLSPGRGLRGAPAAELAFRHGDGSFAVSAGLADGIRLGSGSRPDAPARRVARVNGATVPLTALAEHLALLWLTPAMDRLFMDSAGARRRYLDRLVMALDPGHARHASRYEAAFAERNRLLAAPQSPDPAWLTAIELRMADHGGALAAGRRALVADLHARLGDVSADGFPAASLSLEGDRPDADIAADLARNRSRDRAAGRTTAGPHRVDLLVEHRNACVPARLASTGEQKALLIGITLAMAALVQERRGPAPVLLFDEVAAHLDSGRRERLFARIGNAGWQCWMTGTDLSLFEALPPGSTRLFLHGPGRLEPLPPR